MQEYSNLQAGIVWLATAWIVRGWDDIFDTYTDRPWVPPSGLCNWYRVTLPGLYWLASGVHHPTHLAPRLKKEKSYTLSSLWAFMAWSRVNCTVTTYRHTNTQCLAYNSLCLLKLWVYICVSSSVLYEKLWGQTVKF